MQRSARIVAVLMVVFLFCGCKGKTADISKPRPPDYWPTEGWRSSTPEEQGVDSEKLAEALAFIGERDVNVHSMLIVRNGYVVLDAYLYPFAPGLAHDVASVTKSFTSTLIGIAIDKGYIAGVQQPLVDFFPGRTIANMDARKKSITLEDVLTMSSGLGCEGGDFEATLFQMMASPDWVQFMLDLPMTDEPGTRFVYCSGGSHLLSAIIHDTTGMNELAFAQENLFEPLGISGVIWPTDPQGINNHGWGDLHVTPHDMAKLGLLYLNEGKWDGKQILSSEYVRAATKRHVAFADASPFDGYGYQWWIDSSGFYAAQGRGEQLILVLPGMNMVVVLTSGIGTPRGRENLLEVMTSYVIPAAESDAPLPANSQGDALLESKVREAALAPREERTPAPPLPDTANRISGRTYVLEPNQYGLRTLSLTFQSQEEALFQLSLTAAVTGDQQLHLPVGLDNVYRVSRKGRFGLPAALKGAWENDNTFVIDFDEVGNINRWHVSMTFDNKDVAVHMQEETGLGEASFGGTYRP